MIRRCLSTKGLARSHGLSKASGTAQGSSHRSLERVHASGHGTEGGGAMHSDGYNLTMSFQSLQHSLFVCGQHLPSDGRHTGLGGLAVSACTDVLKVHVAESITERPGVTA